MNAKWNKEDFTHFKSIFKTQIVHARMIVNERHAEDKEQEDEILGF